MRTNIVIDDRLMAEAQQLSGMKTKRETVELALEELIALHRRRGLLELPGKVKWVGDLDEMRQGRF